MAIHKVAKIGCGAALLLLLLLAGAVAGTWEKTFVLLEYIWKWVSLPSGPHY